MNASILNSIISHLAQTRPFYYSEADFQHYLAMALRYAGYKVFLEYPVLTPTGYYYIDIVIEDKGVYYPIELKYKTKKDLCSGLLTPYTLKDQSANDIGRYLFWEDVNRIEVILGQHYELFAEGYVIMLTNDEKYWKVPSRPVTTIDQYFKMHPGMTVNKVHWANTKSAPSYNPGHSNYPAFTLGRSYDVPEWNPYSKAYNSNRDPKREFRFLTIVVK